MSGNAILFQFSNYHKKEKKKSRFPAGTLSGSSAGNKTIDIKNQYSAIVTVIICQRLCIKHFKPPRLAATSM